MPISKLKWYNYKISNLVVSWNWR